MIRTKVLIPSDELSLNEKRAAKQAAINLGVAKAISRGIGGEGSLIARPPQNIADFTTPLEQWNTAPLLVVGNPYSVFQNQPNPLLANNKVVVWFGVICETAPIPVSLLNFRQGAAGGTTYAQFDMEQLVAELRTVGYFSEPIAYEPGEVLNITVTCRIATLLLARIQLMGYVIEPVGPTLSK